MMLPEGSSFGKAKYSVSTRSKEFGWVMTRLATSSVVTAIYSILIPRSSPALAAMAGDWFTAVDR